MMEKVDNNIEEEGESARSGSFLGYGWLNIRPKAFKLLNSTRFLLCLLCSYFVANSTVINGLYSTSISTIEKRFLLSSSRMGVVTSIYDVAALIFTGPVSYFGTRNKPVTLGLGMIVMGIGYLIFISPHFIADEYIPVTGAASASVNYSNPLICAAAGSRAPSAACSSKEGSNLYYGLFALAMFVAGAGCTPMISLGIPYLDENVSKENSPLYVGLFQTSGIFAAVLGFLLASVFLGIFVHPTANVSIKEKSPSWIGAWWLGIALGAVFAFIIGILLTGLPRKFQRNEQSKSKEELPHEKMDEEDGDEHNPTAKEILSILKTLILKNPVFVLISTAVSVQSFLISGGTAFNAKIALFQYRLTASEVSVYYGLSTGLGAIIGNTAGSILLKKCQFSSLGMLKFSVIMSIITTVLGLNSFLYCDTYPVPGVNSKFPDSNSTSMALNIGCNSGCSCTENMFVPVCIEGLTYVNPCNAGCKNLASATVFSNCSCIPSSKRRTSTGKVGLCKTSCGILPVLYFVMAWFLGFAIMCNATPCTMATLRCVPNNLRSFALGLQWMLVRVLGSIPGPILFGYIIDRSCVFWSKK